MNDDPLLRLHFGLPQRVRNALDRFLGIRQ
jgi:hypothetical protein